MAIWQHKIFIVPSEEIESYFGKNTIITMYDFENIDWWKYKKINVQDFLIFNNVLEEKKSWTKDIIQYGHLDSTCLEIIIENSKVVEVSTRIDLRKDNQLFFNELIYFALKNNLLFLSFNKKEKLHIIYPNRYILKDCITIKKADYDSFLDTLKE